MKLFLKTRQSRRRFGLCLVAVLVLAACSKASRDFDNFRKEDADADGQGGGGGQDGDTDVGQGGAPPVSCEGNVDPDCECVGNTLKAVDKDDDGKGTRECEAAPGIDCDDDNGDFIGNECGGCTELSAALGSDCGGCGEVACNGEENTRCSTPDNKRTCDAFQPQLCVNEEWFDSGASCAGGSGYCDADDGLCHCEPGTFKCGTYSTSSFTYEHVLKCNAEGTEWESKTICGSISSTQCDATTGTCLDVMLHPRDSTFEIPTLVAPTRMPAPSTGSSTRDVLDRAQGFDFG